MIQVEIIENKLEKSFVEDLNYFLERLSSHQLIDIKFHTSVNDSCIIYHALIIYKTE